MAESAGKAVSPTELKANLGRGVALRPGKHHQGRRADPTAWEALQRAAAGREQRPLTKLEMELLFRENQSEVRILQNAGFSKEQIYEYLKDR